MSLEASTVHRIGLVRYADFIHAWVLDLPGCVVGERDIAKIEAMLPIVITDHIGWLRSHGEDLDATDEWDIVETIEAPGSDFIFDAEREPLSRTELERLIARTGYARDDVIDATRGVPDAVLDWVPPASAFASFDPWAPDVRTIRGLLRHVLQLEVYYRDGLRDGSAAGVFESVEDSAVEHARTVEALRPLDNDDRSRVFRPLRPGQAEAEAWTVRKVARRLISHDRAHAAEISQRRTWLLLGVPDGSR